MITMTMVIMIAWYEVDPDKSNTIYEWSIVKTKGSIMMNLSLHTGNSITTQLTPAMETGSDTEEPTPISTAILQENLASRLSFAQKSLFCWLAVIVKGCVYVFMW